MALRNLSAPLGLAIYVLAIELADGANTSNSSTDQGCMVCHVPDPLFSHPVDATPSFPIPEDFPLTDGMITCGTCHIDEGGRQYLNANGGAHPSALRSGMLTGVSFCMQCHLRNGTDLAMAHGAGTTQAHLRWSRRPDEPAWLDSEWSDQAFEQASGVQDTCSSCHDGDIAEDTHTLSFAHGMRSSSHPVGVRHSPSANRRARSRLTPISELDRRIRLFGGNVECGSCHSIFSQQPKLLVLSNVGSRLCFSCHDM